MQLLSDQRRCASIQAIGADKVLLMATHEGILRASPKRGILMIEAEGSHTLRFRRVCAMRSCILCSSFDDICTVLSFCSETTFVRARRSERESSTSDSAAVIAPFVACAHMCGCFNGTSRLGALALPEAAAEAASAARAARSIRMASS